MRIDEKSISLGINEDIANYLVSKTKRHRGKTIISITFNGTGRDNIHCIKAELENSYITLHVTRAKILMLNRDFNINKLLN